MSFQDVKFAFRNQTLNSGRNNIYEGKHRECAVKFHLEIFIQYLNSWTGEKKMCYCFNAHSSIDLLNFQV